MNKLLNILDESYNPNIYQVECRVVMNVNNRAIPEIISDIRAIPGITTVNTINSDYNTEEGRHVIDLSIKVDPSPFNPFGRSSYIKILNDIKKLPDVRGAKFISSPVVTENTLQRLIKEVLSKKKEKRDRCLRIADRKYDKPSAYKSGAVVRCRKGEIWKNLKEEEHKLYAKEKFEAELIEGKVGYLYHSTNIIAALNIIKQNQINPANITLKQYIGTDNPPWWYSDEFGEPQPLYGDFIYASSKEKGNYYGVSNPEITFVIDGDKVKNSGIDIYKAPETMEEGVCLIQGPVDLKFIKQIIINEDFIDKEDKLSVILLSKNKNIKYIVKETDDPQSGKAAPYGSGYAKLKDIIKEIIQEDESLHKWFKRKDPSGEETSCDLGYKKLNEVGEANLTPYKWEEEDVDGYWTYVEFTTDEGTEYNVALEVMNYTPKNSTSYVKALNIEFAVTVKDAGDYSYSTTNVIMNKGELYRVMSTIAAIVKHYVKKYKIQAIIYSPSKKTGEEFGTQRNNLYKAFISKAIQGVEFQQKGNMVVAILPNNTIQKEGKALPYDSGYSELKEIIKEIIQEDESLHKWFKRKGPSGKEGGWVDCNTCRKVNGKTKCKSCGRKKGEKRDKYPSCRPTPSQCKSPGKGKKWGKTK
jgi:hypothetical protein